MLENKFLVIMHTCDDFVVGEPVQFCSDLMSIRKVTDHRLKHEAEAELSLGHRRNIGAGYTG